MRPDYDVAIMGGGPAGASLGARLADAQLRTVILEEQVFPREHIGESLASPAIPCLVESGALGPVLSRSCWVRKFGGYYSWDSDAPSAGYFRHRQWEADGIHRWSLHVDRAAFDYVLLRHARARGAHVYEDSAVESVERTANGTRVCLREGTELTCRIFVDASGRMNRASALNGRGWLSSYRNIAIWTHFAGGLPAQSLPGDWNIFRSGNLSPIGCFAFELGWVWYIPVIQTVNGSQIRTHSIGIVTDPKVLKLPATRLTDPGIFLDTLRTVPLLRDLIRDIAPVKKDLRTATNYSMISSKMNDFDDRWIAIGDAAFFVDPLFSSGVSFAMLQAAAAARLIQVTLSDDLDEDMKRGLWNDYSDVWTLTATSFAASIDQWYAAIAHANPNSVYWNERSSDQSFFNRMTSFEWLLDADVTGDLIQIMTRGSGRLNELPKDGALMRSISEVVHNEPREDSVLRLQSGVTVCRSATLNAKHNGLPDPWSHGPYWEDPMKCRQEVAPLYGDPRSCFRFRSREDEGGYVRFFDEESGRNLARLLTSGRPYGALRSELSEAQWDLLLRLIAARMVEVENRAHAQAAV